MKTEFFLSIVQIKQQSIAKNLSKESAMFLMTGLYELQPYVPEAFSFLAISLYILYLLSGSIRKPLFELSAIYLSLFLYDLVIRNIKYIPRYWKLDNTEFSFT